MQFKKTAISVVIILAVLGVGLFIFFKINKKTPEPAPVATVEIYPKVETIGKSVEGRNIEAYTYGKGATHLLFVGGIHGGYEWNSVLLAYKFMDYLKANPSFIPENFTVAVIPSANPDGVYAVTGKEGRFTEENVVVSKEEVASGLGRFNANGVDLNRNFDCKWKPKSTWKTKTVSAGSEAFSEPEARAIRDFVSKYKPDSVIFWHSQSNAVYASECEGGILPKTLDIMNAYSKDSGYPAVKSFSAYAISGDAEGWLASINIPAITVELKTHETLEWEQNLAGIKALFEYYGK